MSDPTDPRDGDGQSDGAARMRELDVRLAALRKRMEEGLPARARELRDAAEAVERDPAGTDTVRRLAHKLRGVAATHGHAALGASAAELEEQACLGAPPAALATGARALADAIDRASSNRTRDETSAAPLVSARAPARIVQPMTKPLLGATIAAVDDDDATRRLLELTLGPIGGAQARVVPSPQALYEVVRGETIDLVVVDAMMPNATGWDVIHALVAEHGPKTPRCAVLSAASAAELGWAFEPSIDVTWLRKPFRPSELVAALALLLRR